MGTQLPRPFDHPFCLPPGVGEMLVGENRHGSLIAAKDVCHLFQQLMPWVEFLAFCIPRIVAVFTYNQDSIDCQLVSAQAECFANRWIDLELMLLGQSSTQVIR